MSPKNYHKCVCNLNCIIYGMNNKLYENYQIVEIHLKFIPH